MTSFARPHAAMLPDVDAERLDLAAFLESLEEEEWQTPSLCAGWTVHHVLAHLALSTRQPFLSTMIRVARARGDFHRVEADLAVEYGRAHQPRQLIAQLRETAGSPYRFPLSGALDPLTDIADWSSGPAERNVPEVRGPVGDILLLATGRSAGLTGLTGEGADEVATRMDRRKVATG
jgi:hypothetical protein